MMKKMTKNITMFFVAILLIAVPCDLVCAVSYTTYTNDRFGYRIKYPKFFKQSKKLPTNGDGITMSGKGAKLIMWGQIAVLYTNGREMKKSYLKYGKKMSAVRAKRKSLYYESRKGKKITFHYSYFVSGGIISMELTCKKSKKKTFQPMVNKMVKSIRRNKYFNK